MNRMQQQVLDFHRACGLTTSEHMPFIDWDDTNGIRRELLMEEVQEWESAAFHEQDENTIREACDILYVLYGWAVAQGIDLEPYFEEVHAANMRKASGPKREDGKQLKPEGWQEPNMQRVTEATYNTIKLFQRSNR